MPLAERLAAWGLALAAVLLVLLGERLPLGTAAAAWAAGLIAAALLFRRTWLWLFGPVFVYDLVRTSRRGRYFAVRCGYAALLLAVLFFYYNRWFHVDVADLFEVSAVPPALAAQFAEGFFTAFLIVQFIAAVALTPLLTAGAITEEKERRTFEYLLTTQLDNREIVLGKLGARLGQLALLVFTGLPVLSLLQFMGGVDPELVLASSLITAFAVLSTACVGLCVSVHCRTTTNAVFITYVCIGGCFTLTSCLGGCASVVPALNLGNPYHAYVQIAQATGPDRTSVLTSVLLGYCGSHAALALVCVLMAVKELRGPALEAFRKQVPPPRTIPRATYEEMALRPPTYRPRPPVGDHALLWKELNDSPIRLGETHSELRGCLGLFVVFGVAIFTPIVLLEFSRNEELWPFQPSQALLQTMQTVNITMRGLGTGIACLMLLVIAVNASARVSREWEKHTLAGLLTLPVERGDILVSKWLASMLHVRGLCWFFAWFWLMAFLTGGPSLVGLACLLLACLIYAAFVAVVGTWFSVVTRSTLRSTLWTPLAALAVPSGAWVYLEWTTGALLRAGADRRLVRAAEQFQQYGLAPPMALWVLSDWRGWPWDSEPVLAALAGLGLYLLLTMLLWKAARARFRILTDEVAAGGGPKITDAG